MANAGRTLGYCRHRKMGSVLIHQSEAELDKIWQTSLKTTLKKECTNKKTWQHAKQTADSIQQNECAQNKHMDSTQNKQEIALRTKGYHSKQMNSFVWTAVV